MNKYSIIFLVVMALAVVGINLGCFVYDQGIQYGIDMMKKDPNWINGYNNQYNYRMGKVGDTWFALEDRDMDLAETGLHNVSIYFSRGEAVSIRIVPIRVEIAPMDSDITGEDTCNGCFPKVLPLLEKGR